MNKGTQYMVMQGLVIAVAFLAMLFMLTAFIINAMGASAMSLAVLALAWWLLLNVYAIQTGGWLFDVLSTAFRYDGPPINEIKDELVAEGELEDWV